MKADSVIKNIALWCGIRIVTSYCLFSQRPQQLLSLVQKNLIILPTRIFSITNITLIPLLILLWVFQNSGSLSHPLEDHHQGTERTTFKRNAQAER